MSDFNYTSIDKAYKRISSNVLKTPLITSEYINNLLKAKVYFKLENLQWTGSFKLRGATNKIFQLNQDQKQRGLVAYSSGNHAQAVAYASKIKDINAKIYDILEHYDGLQESDKKELTKIIAQIKAEHMEIEKHPRTFEKLKKKDIKTLKETPALFARKFSDDSDILKHIDSIW